jgi:hypothetical protein
MFKNQIAQVAHIQRPPDARGTNHEYQPALYC